MTADSNRKFLLWDASVIIPYYLSQTSKNKKAMSRSKLILDSVRNHRLDAFCFIPNIVIAEVFTAFARDHYSAWDKQITRKYKGGTLDARLFNKAREKFRNDIHNTALFYQYDINRYHILALDLIAPIDKYRKYYRKGHVKSMGASDLLIGAMGMHMSKIHGHNNSTILTADRRMKAIFDDACRKLSKKKAHKLKLDKVSKELKFGEWNGKMYPNVIDLQRCKDSELIKFFGEWPLKTRKIRGKAPKA